jgi:hypothetical protein
MKMKPNSTHPDRERDYGTHPDRRDFMISAAELRDEAVRMRAFALTVTDPEVLAEIHTMADEWERRARGQGNGGASD